MFSYHAIFGISGERLMNEDRGYKCGQETQSF